MVLDRDPWTVQPSTLRTTVVLATYLDGVPVYCGAGFCERSDAPALTVQARAAIAERQGRRQRWLRATAGAGATDVRPAVACALPGKDRGRLCW